MISGGIWLGKEFKCPNCAVRLRLLGGRLFVLVLLSLVAWILAFGIICYVLGTEPLKAIVFEGNIIAGAFSWLTLIFYFILGLKVKLKLEVIQLGPP